jgi:hypothetical protein
MVHAILFAVSMAPSPLIVITALLASWASAPPSDNICMTAEGGSNQEQLHSFMQQYMY